MMDWREGWRTLLLPALRMRGADHDMAERWLRRQVALIPSKPERRLWPAWGRLLTARFENTELRKK